MAEQLQFSVSEFKAKALGLLERVASRGISFTITKHGKPIANVIPHHPHPETAEKTEPGRLAHTVLEEKDIVTPLGAELWKASK